jgi:microcystin-dependent protein
MSEPFIAEIIMFGANWAPRSWARCDGQLLPVAQNTALFSLIGTIYGGDGRTTFALPDLRGRVPIHEGTGLGLTPRTIGQRSGEENVTLTVQEMPAHNHAASFHTESKLGTNPLNPTNKLFASGNSYADPDPGDNRTLAPEAISMQNTGGNQSHRNMQPYLVVNFIIALQGLYPSRS